MGKKRAPLQLTLRQLQQLVGEPEALAALLREPGRATDLLRAIAQALQPGGVLNTAEGGLRLQVLKFLEQHAVELCSDAPTDLLRQLYETVRDRSVAAAHDAPALAARLQQAALHTLTVLLTALEMQQRDARLVKVHVETLFRIMERSGPHAAAPTELCRCAATCLRLLEEAAPTLLLAGSKQLLELARQEAGAAAESYAMLAARVLAHGAARCLDLQRTSSDDGSRHCHAYGAAAARQGAIAAADSKQDQGGEEEQDAHAVLSSIDVRALLLGGGAGDSGSTSDGEAPTPPGARAISPAGTLDAVAQSMTTFASGRTAGSSEGLSSPKEAPGSPRGVASVLGTVSTSDESARSALSAAAAGTLAPGAQGAARMTRQLTLGSEISGSVQLDGDAPQPLLAATAAGLRHFRVPQHLHWPDALGHAALPVYLTPDAKQDLQQACLEFLAALPLMSVEGVACVTAALPPLMRLAELPPAQLQEELDALLKSGRTLLLQAVLKLYSEVPEGFAEWRERLVDAVVNMVNAPHPTELRIVAATWCLVQHHAQMHARQASLFAGTWRQLLPRPDDPPQLLSLKVKALSACLAVGIGRPEEICLMVFAWDGFWQAAPTDQQQRLATYALRMLGSAAVSYAALPPEQAAAAQRCARLAGCQLSAAAPTPPATPHYVTACLVSACLQLLATRPQYLPAVEAFLASCSSGSAGLQVTILNAADALLSAAATGTFARLAPQQAQRAGAAVPRQRSGRQLTGGLDGGVKASATLGSLGGMLSRVARSVSKKLSPSSSPTDEPGSLQAAAEASSAAAASHPPAALAAAAEASPYGLAAPQPPSALESWEEAEAWLWDSRTWTTLSTNMLAHDPMLYRTLLLRLAQSGTAALPMGALRFLAAYASQYQGEQPGHALPAKEAGNCVLAICQAAAMTHLLVGPAGTAQAPNAAAAATPRGKPGHPRPTRGRARTRACDEGSSHRGSVHSVHGVPGGASLAASQRSASPGGAPTDVSVTPQWTLQQEEVALAMQAVLAALTSHFPVESVRRRAQSFLDLLANPSAWDLRLRVGTMAKMLGGYFSDAVSIASYL